MFGDVKRGFERWNQVGNRKPKKAKGERRREEWAGFHKFHMSGNVKNGFMNGGRMSRKFNVPQHMLDFGVK